MALLSTVKMVIPSLVNQIVSFPTYIHVSVTFARSARMRNVRREITGDYCYYCRALDGRYGTRYTPACNKQREQLWKPVCPVSFEEERRYRERQGER